MLIALPFALGFVFVFWFSAIVVTVIGRDLRQMGQSLQARLEKRSSSKRGDPAPRSHQGDSGQSDHRSSA